MPTKTDVLSLPEQLADMFFRVYLDQQQLLADIAYSDATSFCDNCPRLNWDDWTPQSYDEMEWGPSIAATCCKDDPEYGESSREYIKRGDELMKSIRTFLGKDADELIEAARKKLGVDKTARF